MTTTLNGCHNKPRPVAGAPLKVQDGYHSGMFSYEDGSSDRIPRIVEVPHVMKTDCQYSKTTVDPRCAGREHNNQGGV